MTRIKAEDMKKGKYNIFRLEVEGHADKINDGEGNILCAAISMIVQTFAAWALQMQKSAEKIYNTVYIPGDGKAEICFAWLELTESNIIVDAKARTGIEMLMTGLEMLAEKYPDHITYDGGVYAKQKGYIDCDARE